MKDNVNHPSHYEKGNGRPECIEMLTTLVEPYRGITSFCLGQLKYLYRAGSKAEEGLTKEQKTVEDIKKLRWYMNYLKSFAEKDLTVLQPDLSKRTLEDFKVDLIADEFCEDKVGYIKDSVRSIISSVYFMDSMSHLENVIIELDEIIRALSEE